MCETAQYLHSELHPHTAECDICHNPDNKVLLYDVCPEADHLVHTGIWYIPLAVNRQASATLCTSGMCRATLMYVNNCSHTFHLILILMLQSSMTPSSDMVWTGESALSVAWYYNSMKPVDLQLNTMFATSFSDDYEDYRAVSQAGRFYEDDQSTWLGRTIVHKLQVHMHCKRLIHQENLPSAFL